MFLVFKLSQLVSKVEKVLLFKSSWLHPTTVFDCLQHVNMEGEGLVYIHHMNGVN